MTNEPLVCDICELREGESFPVIYGKALVQRNTPTRGSTATRVETTYGVGGSTRVGLCRGCVRRHRLQTLQPGAALAVAGLIAMVVGFMGFLPGQMSISAGVAGFFATVFGIAALAIWVSQQETFAARYAVKRREAALKEEGWNAFWTEKEYARLEHKQGLQG